MKLPNAERAIVDLLKLRDYSLSPTHPRGRHKARIFLAALELAAADAEDTSHSLAGIRENWRRCSLRV